MMGLGKSEAPSSAQVLTRAALLRSTVFNFTALFALLALVGSVLSSAGCGATGEDASFEADGKNRPTDPNNSSGGETTFGGTDASAVSTTALRGSPLCGVMGEKCLPDDDGTKPAYGGGRSCVEPLEAGAPAADASSITTACRTVVTNDSYSPGCFEADRRGIDGVACTSGSDCAPGFDCVAGEKGDVCRRYCCLGSGSCATHTSQNGGPTFCDIQNVVGDPPHKAPVCMPLKKCKLLVDGECSEKETCAVVTEKGDSGCVQTGSAKAGDPCDKERCGVNLTCIGNPGDRHCYKLCRVSGTDCGPTQSCMTGTVFQNTMYGVCKELP